MSAKKAKYVYGITNAKLNLREKPSFNAGISYIIPKQTKIRINLSESTDTFYSVVVDSLCGYVAKKFVDLAKKEEEKTNSAAQKPEEEEE